MSLAVVLFSSDNCFTQESVEHFKNLLEGQGFTVQEGSLYLFNPADLFGNYILPSCFCNNADSPYAVYLIPEARSGESQQVPLTYKLKENEKAQEFISAATRHRRFISVPDLYSGRFYKRLFHRYFGQSSAHKMINISLNKITQSKRLEDHEKDKKASAPTIKRTPDGIS